MDQITREICDMYAKFPYPSSVTISRKLKELANLLKIFCMETRYDLAGKSVLDAGTGTGHRLIEAAAAFKKTRFTAVDISEPPLAIARETARNENVTNVEFLRANLMENHSPLGVFDIVLTMGVVHHLSDPAAGLRNLVRNLADDGILFMYIYGKLGGLERMRRKRIVSLLLDKDGDHAEKGIGLVRDLGFDSFEYGWNLGFDDEQSRKALIVDAYLNVNEKLFTVDDIFQLMRSSGLDGFLIYGVTLKQNGCLFETRLTEGHGQGLMTTDVATLLSAPSAQQAYQQLSLADRYRVLDLLVQPNGYTIMGFKKGALQHLPANGRIPANMLMIENLTCAS